MNKDLDLICEVRDYVEDDKSFVMATWLRGLYYGESWFSLIPKDIFMFNYKQVIEKIIESPNNVVKVACLREDPSVILGYSVMSSDFSTVHWVQVKKAWRNKGLATSLLPKHPQAATHLTKVGRDLLHKFNNCVFNPFNIGV